VPPKSTLSRKRRWKPVVRPRRGGVPHAALPSACWSALSSRDAGHGTAPGEGMAVCMVN